jgi:hypothetical protein
VVLATAAGAAHDGRAPLLEPGWERAPYLQSLDGSSVVIAWIASAPGTPLVDWGTTLAYGRTAEASSEGPRRHLRLVGLEPGTEYFYRVRAGERVLAAGPEYRFATDAGRQDGTVSFFVTGDVGTDALLQVWTAESIRRATPRPELGVVCGDLVYGKGSSRDYDAHLMHPWRELLCNTTLWPALGNHDWKSRPTENWEVEWHLPNNEHWYSFDRGNAHFVALDTADGGIFDVDRQARWLDEDLARNRDAEWTFVYFHHPGITCTYKKNNRAVIEHFLPVFDRWRVDVAFAGHAHTYERLHPIARGEVVDAEQEPYYVDPRGTIYIVSGAGGKTKAGQPTKLCGPTAFFRDETLLWTHVVVDGATCTIRTLSSEDDRPIDEITITKTRSGRLSEP